MCKGSPSSFERTSLLCYNRGVTGMFRVGDHFMITLNAFITNESTLTDHLFGNSGRALRRSGNDVCNLAFRSSAERAAKAASFHFCNHRQLPGAVTHYSRCAITSSIKPYSLAWAADIILSRSTSRSTVSYDWPVCLAII